MSPTITEEQVRKWIKEETSDIVELYKNIEG